LSPKWYRPGPASSAACARGMATVTMMKSKSRNERGMRASMDSEYALQTTMLKETAVQQEEQERSSKAL
jgi:hypothetical protein